MHRQGDDIGSELQGLLGHVPELFQAAVEAVQRPDIEQAISYYREFALFTTQVRVALVLYHITVVRLGSLFTASALGFRRASFVDPYALPPQIAESEQVLPLIQYLRTHGNTSVSAWESGGHERIDAPLAHAKGVMSPHACPCTNRFDDPSVAFYWNLSSESPTFAAPRLAGESDTAGPTVGDAAAQAERAQGEEGSTAEAAVIDASVPADTDDGEIDWGDDDIGADADVPVVGITVESEGAALYVCLLSADVWMPACLFSCGTEIVHFGWRGHGPLHPLNRPPGARAAGLSKSPSSAHQ